MFLVYETFAIALYATLDLKYLQNISLNIKFVIMSLQVEELFEEEVLVAEANTPKVILFNDDHNTFDYVIDCLVNYCEHDPLQAEQCSILVHYKGKCDVYSGAEAKVLTVANTLANKGLTVEVSYQNA